ncbi:DUF3397 family protein [Ornithinibacillus gellani]|uniref:DUF3397 family protein n=1 Tax=Ornithinibacillus gellani TaxID=2293253 RepID=UPI001CC1FE1F|nr:DUF3397 family protein [Ornithinibacillus gellani]
MLDYLVYVIAFFVTIPIIATLLVYKLTRWRYENQWFAVHRAVNWTGGLYIIAVLMILQDLFQRTYITFILIFFLFIFTAVIFFQWKRMTEVDFAKAFKVTWRGSFLVFLLLYVFLVIIGIGSRIFG